ncbi:MAG: pyruvate:ferredoxin (flavodoxin) oxidoreductase [Firmicutes bacterium]|nr:pyruvate:ferredoxin (flavodoxin) oxidoreductase [Bacillota bacterium]
MSKTKVMSGNEAAAHAAYAMTESAAIYPITPSSDMSEMADAWSAKGKTNIFGTVPTVVQLQSEAGAAGTLHGLLAGGALATTFTASQGLLLMIPNMYKIVGELLPCVIHVSARTLATHALSIFGDHSDIYSVRSTGFAMICSNSVQEAQDMALVSHLSAIEAEYPFLHFFDGFRTSHEMNKITTIAPEAMRELVNMKMVERFRSRALSPANPHQAGTAQNPDTFFQNREAANKHIAALPKIIKGYMTKVGKLTGKKYAPFEYVGPKTPKHVVVAMGSACETIEETLGRLKNPSYGLLKVRLYRPFLAADFVKMIPESTETLTVLDRTKESGAVGDPLYTDCCAALLEQGRMMHVQSGRYGLASKEFTPNMVNTIFRNITKKHFTIGINDDVTNTSLAIETDPKLADGGGYVFYGLGADGTVSANKNSTYIIGENTDMYTQAYFVYDSKKSGSTTISHLRFSGTAIKSAYLVENPSFVACHNQTFINRFDMISNIRRDGTFLLNTSMSHDELAAAMPNRMKRVLAQKNVKFYTINAYKIARELGLGNRINTIMQSAFFKLSSVIPYDNAIKFMKDAATKSYSKKGEAIVAMNHAAIDSAKSALEQFTVPANWANLGDDKPEQTGNKYFDNFCAPVNALLGNDLPVSAFAPDGRVPTGTSQFEKRNIATTLPRWIPENCIQCNMCSMACPHATIRPHLLANPPDGFETKPAIGFPDQQYRIQLNPRDCTGCGVCANVCPAKNKALVMMERAEVSEEKNYEFSKTIPTPNIETTNIKNTQFKKPYFEFSGACSGCGQTPYIKLVTQLFGDRMVIANATGCTSIYGGSSPVTPYTKDENGRGPAWANSLFEDNAEFGYGIKLAKDITGDAASIWMIGGDGWAYDIGFGGLDHVVASGANVNILILDTEVYSNTGGQSSKATPAGAIAKFAANGKKANKKNLGMMLMNYENVYVAQIAMGASMPQTLRALQEAEAYNGPSVVIAYATCIAHGIDMSNSMREMKSAVDSGYWTLYRRHPEGGLTIDSREPTMDFKEFLMCETRYKTLSKMNPEHAERLFNESQKHARIQYENLKKFLD